MGEITEEISDFMIKIKASLHFVSLTIKFPNKLIEFFSKKIKNYKYLKVLLHSKKT
jgi:hypothetical protein